MTTGRFLRAGFLGGFLAMAVVAAAEMPATIDYSVQEPGNVSVAVYDPGDGRLIRTLLAGVPHEPGEHSVSWDGLDVWGQPLPPGDYEWRLLRTPGFRAEYRVTVGTNPPDAPWAHWPGNHAGVNGVAADDTGLYLGSGHSEVLDTYLKLSPDFKERRWSRYQRIAGGQHAKRLMVSQGRLYREGVDAYMKVMDAETGNTLKVFDIAWEEGLTERPKRQAEARDLSVGAAGVVVVVGYLERGQLRWYDAATGEATATVAVADLQAVGLAGDGTVFVAAGGQLLELAAGGKSHRVLADDLSNPLVVEYDPWGDSLLVVEGEPSHRIKRFSRTGIVLATYGREGGRPEEGRYEPSSSFREIADIAALPDGGFAVTEPAIAPRRTAVFDREGRHVTEWYGGNLYFQSATPAADDPSEIWFDSHWGWLVRARVDYAKGTWTVVGTYRYSGKGGGMIGVHNALPGYAWNAWRPIRRAGVLYLVHEGELSILRYDEEADTLMAVAVARTQIGHRLAQQSELIQKMLGHDRNSPHRSYAWSDLNGDGMPQADEVRLGVAAADAWRIDDDLTVYLSQGGDLYRLPVERWTDAGVPVYPSLDDRDLVAAVDAPMLDGSRALGPAWRAADGDFYSAQRGEAWGGQRDPHGDIWPAHEFGDARLLKFAPGGQVRWAVGRKAAGRPAAETIRQGTPPNHLSVPIRVVGEVNDCVVLAERVVSPATVYTRDGLYAGRFLDGRVEDGLPDHVYKVRGAGIPSVINADMARGSSVILADGGVYWLAPGWNCNPVYRIHGWDGWTRTSGATTLANPSPHARGEGTGLTARYYANPADLVPTGGDAPAMEDEGMAQLHDEPVPVERRLVVERIDERVYFRWGGQRISALPKADALPEVVPAHAFDVAWSGFVEPKYGEPFVFSTYTRGGVRLWVDGELVIDDWTDYAGEQPNQFTGPEYYKRNNSLPMALTAGKLVAIRMEYYQSPPLEGSPERNVPQAHLNWESTTLSRQRIPQAFLYPEEK